MARPFKNSMGNGMVLKNMRKCNNPPHFNISGLRELSPLHWEVSPLIYLSIII